MHSSDELEWTEESFNAFIRVKYALADASLIVHPVADSPISIMADASDLAVGAVL